MGQRLQPEGGEEQARKHPERPRPDADGRAWHLLDIEDNRRTKHWRSTGVRGLVDRIVATTVTGYERLIYAKEAIRAYQMTK